MAAEAQRRLAGVGPGEAECVATRVRVARHLTGELGREEERRLRAHLVGCAGCRDAYREALRAAAGVGHALRVAREEQRRAERRSDVRRRIVASGPSGRTRRLRLQLLLLPAAMIVVLAQWGRWGAGELRVVSLAAGEGKVELAGVPLDPAAEPVAADRGAWCVVRGAGAAELSGGDARLVLGADSALLVHGTRPLRVRLQQGELVVAGRCTVDTALGVVEVEGRARLALEGLGVLRLACEAGELRLTDAAGTHALAPGREAWAERGGGLRPAGETPPRRPRELPPPGV